MRHRDTQMREQVVPKTHQPTLADGCESLVHCVRVSPENYTQYNTLENLAAAYLNSRDTLWPLGDVHASQANSHGARRDQNNSMTIFE